MTLLHLLLSLYFVFGDKLSRASAQDYGDRYWLDTFPHLDDFGFSPDAWLVELKSDITSVSFLSSRMPESLNGEVGFIFKHAFNGFVYYGADIEKLKNDPNVESIVRDSIVMAYRQRFPKGGKKDSRQRVPTGIKRIGANRKDYMQKATQNCRCDAVVAVLDTGVDPSHPDLNVNERMSLDCSLGTNETTVCAFGRSEDVFGHGTHVAGIVGAIRNNRGVVGVCPGAEIWSIKVLSDEGMGFVSWVVAGLEYVLEHFRRIDVINMSLGGPGCNKFMCKAIAEAKRAGIAVAVAAGNSNEPAIGFQPACCPAALTVSSIADSDGKPGGKGPKTCHLNRDDRLANYSNYGSAVDIAAPGDCILSTIPGGKYKKFTGTSMAAPHVAGALAVLASSDRKGDVQSHYHKLKAKGTYDYKDKKADSWKEPLLNMKKVPDAKMVGLCD